MSSATYKTGGWLIAVAVIGSIMWFAFSVHKINSTIDSFARLQIPGSGRVFLEARHYVIYVEGPGADVFTPKGNVVITDPRTQAEIPISGSSTRTSYSIDDKTGASAATVFPAKAGYYDVNITAPDSTRAGGYVLALGDGIGGLIGWSVLGSFLIFGVFGLLGAGSLIRTRRFRKRIGRMEPSTTPRPVDYGPIRMYE